MKFYLMLVLLSLSASSLIAKDIRGRLTNSNGESLDYVTIRLDGTGWGTTSKSDGTFYFKNIPAGQYTLVASLINYKTKTINIEVLSDATTEIGNLELEQSSQTLDEVVVSANLDKYVSKKPSNSIRLDQPLVKVPQNIQVVTSRMISDQQILSMSDGIIRNVSGATRQEHWGDLYTRINMR